MKERTSPRGVENDDDWTGTRPEDTKPAANKPADPNATKMTTQAGQIVKVPPQQGPNMTASAWSSTTFAPIQGGPPYRVPSPMSRDSPHTFVSSYMDWNMTSYATTSDDEDDEKEDEGDEEATEDGVSIDLSHNDKVAHPPRYATRKLIDSDDDDDDDGGYDSASTLSTHEADRIRTGIPKKSTEEEITADCPPNPPVRTQTQEDATTQLDQDIQAKAMGRAPVAGVARKRAPVLRDAKDEDFLLRRRHRLAERHKESVPAAVAARAMPHNPTPVEPRSMAELENESKKRAAASPAVRTRRAPTTTTVGTSALAQQVAARNLARASVTAVAATEDRAARKQAPSRNPMGIPQLAAKTAVSGDVALPGGPLTGKKPSPLQAALLARHTSRTSIVDAPQAVSRAQDRALAKGASGVAPQVVSRAQDRALTKGASVDATLDDDHGPQLAVPDKKPPPTPRPVSTLQEALRVRQDSYVWPMPAAMSMTSTMDRAGRKMADDEDSQGEEEQGPQLALATSRKKAPPTPMIPSGPVSETSRSFAMPEYVSKAMDRVAIKMAQEEQGPQIAKPPAKAGPKDNNPPSDLQAAMQARQTSRSTTSIPMPTAVSRAMDRAGAKIDSAEMMSAEEDAGPQLAVPQRHSQNLPSDLHAAMQSREMSRSSAIPMPVSVSRAMDRAGAKMAENNEGPQLAASTSRAMSPASDLEAAMQARAVSRTTIMPEAVSRAMDRAGAKMGDEPPDDKRGPQLATGREENSNDAKYEAAFDLDKKVAARRVRSGPETIHEDATPRQVPGAVESTEDAFVDKKLGEYVEEEEDQGPTLAAPTIEDEDLPSILPFAREQTNSYRIATIDEEVPSSVSGADVVSVSPTLASNHGIDPGQEGVAEIQEGLIVAEGQTGAYAVPGIDAQGEDDLYHDAFDPTSGVFDEEAPIMAASVPSQATVHASPAFDVAPLQAELFDQPLFQGDIYEEDDLENDPKFQRRLRIMQVIILCSSLFGIAFVVISVVTGLDPGTAPAPSIRGWRSMGNTTFGPSIEESQVFFASSMAMSADGTRIVVAAPGTDTEDSFNVGSVHLYREIFINSTSVTWELQESFQGPGTSEIMISPVAMSLAGDRVAVGYPSYSGGQVQVFEEGDGWVKEAVILPRSNASLVESWFGYAIDMSDEGEYLAVGAPRDGNSGSVSIFGRSSDVTWVSIGDPIPAQGPAELFGWSVSLAQTSTLRVAVGAPSSDTETGLVRVYDWAESAWTQVGETLRGESILSRFGETCALSADGTVLAVGVRGSPFEAGKVVVYRQIQGNWVADSQVILGPEAGGGFGAALSMTPDGSSLAIGGPGNNAFGDNSGHIQVWRYDGATWTQQGSSIGGEVNAAYGSSVALSPDGQRVAGGAPLAAYDSSIPENGYFHVYDRDETVGR